MRAAASALVLAGCVVAGTDDVLETGDGLTGTDDLLDTHETADSVGGTGDTGGDAVPTVSFASGARLRVDLWTVGGATSFARFFDTQLEVACRPAPAADGVLRCLPVPGSLVAGFADPECTEPVWIQPANACTVSGWVEAEAGPSPVCGFVDQAAMLPLTVLEDVTTGFLDGANGCTALPPAARPAVVGTTGGLGGQPTPPDDFVALAQVVEAGDVGRWWWVAEDGAVAVQGLAIHGAPCDVLPWTDDAAEGRCVPTSRALRTATGPWGDDACTGVPLATDERQGTCGPPRVAVLRRDDGLLEEAWGIGDLWTDDVFAGSSEVCVPRTITAAQRYVTGAPRARAGFPAVEAVHAGADVAGGRAIGADGVTVPDPATPFHTSADQPCAPSPTDEDTWVCVPPDARIVAATGFYADAGCTTDPVLDAGDDPEGTIAVRLGIATCVGDTPSPVVAAWALGPEVTGTIHQWIGGTCIELPPLQRTWRRAEALPLAGSDGRLPEVVQAPAP